MQFGIEVLIHAHVRDGLVIVRVHFHMTELRFVYESFVEMENHAVTSNHATPPLAGTAHVIR